MAKPTQEEIEKQIKRLEAEMLGGYVPPSVYQDLLGVPKVAGEALYLKTPYPAGLSLGTSGGTPLKQTTLDELTDLKLALEEEKLKKFGLSMSEEEKKTKRAELYQQGYDDYIKPPLSTAYGDLKEKAKGQPAIGIPFVGGKIPEAPSMSKEGEAGLLTPFKVQSKSIDTEIDWAGFKDLLVKEGKTAEEAQEAVNVSRRSLDAYMRLNPNLDANTAYSNLMDEMEAIANAPKIEKPEVEGFEKTTSAFGRQVTEADMPQDLTPEQMELAKEMIKINQDKVYQATKAIDPSTNVPHIRVTIDATGTNIDIPKSIYQAIMASNPKLPNYEPFIDEKTDNLIRNGQFANEVNRPLNKGVKNVEQAIENYAKAEAIMKAGDPNAWYLNPNAKKAVLENPEKYVQEGFFTDTSPFGDVAETGGAYGFRMVMSPLNAIAGVLQPIAEVSTAVPMQLVAEAGEAFNLLPEADYFDPLALARQREKARQKETPLYADSPILANIALNKGFTGEAQDIANAMNLQGWERNVVIGGGFLMDIASPDVAIVASTAKAGKGLSQFGKANKAMYGTSEGAIKQALKGAGNTFMNDLNGVSAILSKTKRGKALKEVPHGSVVSHIGETNASLLRAQRGLGTATDLTEVESIIKSLPEKHPYRQQIENFAVRDANGKLVNADIDAMSQVDALAYARQADPTNAKLLDEWADTHKALDEVSAGRTLDKADPLAKANLDLINNVSSSRYGKSFAKLDPSDQKAVIDATKDVIDGNYAKAITLNTLGPKQLAELDKMFAITKNTWAHENVAPKIIAEANKTELGKVLADIRSTGKVPSAMPFSKGVRVPFTDIGAQRKSGDLFYTLTDQQADKLAELVLENPNVPQQLKTALRDIENTRQISFEDFRGLIDANIDNTAKGMGSALGAEDVSRLTGTEQERLLDLKGERGLLTRGLALTRKGVEKLANKLLKDTILEVKEAEVITPSIQLRRAQKEIMQEASGMDKKLRSVFDGLLGNDPELRRIYGVPDGVELNAEQALSYAIVGPKEGRTTQSLAQDITALADWATSRVFFTNNQKVSFMDRFTGRQQIITNDLLSVEGRREWELWCMTFGDELANGTKPAGDFLKIMQEEMFVAYNNILQNPKNLKIGVKEADITKRLDKAINEATEEFAIACFYNAEGSRIINRKLKELTDASVLALNPKQALGKDFGRLNILLGGKAEATFKEAVSSFVINGQNAHINHESVMTTFISQDPTLQRKWRASGGNFEVFYQSLTTNAEKGKLSAYATATRRAEDTANAINQTLKLNPTKLPTDVNNITDMVEFLAKDENLGKLVLGGLYDELLGKARQQQLTSLTAELDRVLRGSTVGEATWRTIHNFFMGVNSIFYNSLLSWNPRFHGGNTVTAPAIMYQTTGTTAGFNPRKVNLGQRVAFQAQDPSKKFFYEVAIIDKAGRPWTYGELNRILLEGGVESQFEFVTKGLGNNGLLNYVKSRNTKNFGLNIKSLNWLDQKTLNIPKGLVMKEDQVFRATAMIDALENGKSIEDATTIARKSLFDYNDMKDWEKATASRYFVFYSFQRQNLASFVEAMGDARKMKRFLNTYKFKRGAEVAVVEANDNKRFDDRFFFDDKFSNRIMLNIMSREEDMVAFASPAIPALDAPLQAFRLFYDPLGEAGQVTAGLLNPAIKRFIKVPSKFDREYYRIPPEVLNPALLPNAPFYDLNDPMQVASFWQGWLGGSITPREGTPAEGAINGYVYPLDENQRAKLKSFLETIGNTTGLVSMNSNYYKLFQGEATTYEDVPFPARVATTPMKLTEKDRIELYNLKARQEALESELKQKKSELRRQRSQ